jgi:dienelactone hydrolase
MHLAYSLALAVLCTGCGVASRTAHESPAGHWRGSVTFRGAELPLAVTISRRGDSLLAVFSSPDLLILDQPLRNVAWDPPRIRFQAEELGETIRFDGTVRGDTLRGTMLLQEPGSSEAPLATAFTLVRGEAPRVPYLTEDVAFKHGDAALSGTLFLPEGAGPHPAVVFVHGSSLDLRDGYRFYADHFARAGVAALIYDKRGSGASSGNSQRATLDDLVGDAEAAVRLLAGRADIDSARVGLWGLSQGAMLAPLIAQRAGAAFVIAVSGPGVSFGETAAYQDSVKLRRRGFTPADAAEAARVHRRLTEWIRTGQGEAELASLMQRTADLPWRRHTGIPRRLPSPEDRAGWYWSTRPLDPIAAWKALRVPALVVLGADDALLPARLSAERIEQALRAGGNRDARVLVLPGGDHMLKRPPGPAGGGGSGWSWPRPVDGYMDTVTHWLLQHVRRP